MKNNIENSVEYARIKKMRDKLFKMEYRPVRNQSNKCKRTSFVSEIEDLTREIFSIKERRKLSKILRPLEDRIHELMHSYDQARLEEIKKKVKF